MKTNSARYAKRGLSICGFGNVEFDLSVVDMGFIHEVFERSGIGRIEALPPSDFREMSMISASNNYFTTKRLVPYETYMRYPEEEDPFGTLHKCAEAAGERMPVVRLKENEIQFYKKT